MLLLSDEEMEARRVAVAGGGDLAALHASLAAELAPVVGERPPVPLEKAMLSRGGGRCDTDGAPLEFDPRSRHRHRCPACGRLHSGELHDRAWIMPYQLWLAERAVHAALFHALRQDAAHAAFARDTLLAYAGQYLAYPNSDNVLGPSRLFFSTYLESIWLLQICIAADCLERTGDAATADVVRDRIVEPARAMIAEYDEGMSNRQVWNNVALLAAAALCGDGPAFDRVIHGTSGLEAHLAQALLADGTWYEGENYHQFALRGLWYAVSLLEARAGALPVESERRFQGAFAVPFATALPDFTMPSRKDSQYAVSLRQWRMAELTELGFARLQEPVLGGALARLYEPGHERRDTGRARSTADVERNVPSGALTRSDLGWRALLHALPELPSLSRGESRSALLEQQGYAVFRRAGGIYVGVEFGQSGGGHGHPDRLNLTLYQGHLRWLDDLGTGSYVDPSLHWYRSTLAHNAPLVEGRSQPLRDGVLLAHDEREGLGWILAEFRIPENDVRLERAVVVAPDYVIDDLSWTASTDVRVELPWHVDVMPTAGEEPVVLDGSADLADGFAFVTDARRVSNPGVWRSRDTPHLLVRVASDEPIAFFRASAPGQPPADARSFLVLRGRGRTGTVRTLISWTEQLATCEEGTVVNGSPAALKDRALSVVCRDGERHVHRRDERGWHVELFAGGARSSIDLSGFRAARQEAGRTPAPHRVPMRIHRASASAQWLTSLSAGNREHLLVYELGEVHYRRSEESWDAAGSPGATVALAYADDCLTILAHVRAGVPLFAESDASNPFDNEHPDTMAAGLQLYVRTSAGAGSWMLIPERGGGRVRARDIGENGLVAPRAQWREGAGGYEIRIELPLAATGPEFPFELDLLINETTAGRKRRRGQLVLSGARGEFVYLRGDRHDPERLIPMVIVG